MVGQAEVIAALERRAHKMWSDPYPLALDDRPFKPTDQNTIFLRHSVVFGEQVRTALGTGYYRTPGLQYLAIFYQTGKGLDTVYKYADEIVAHYTDMILIEGLVKVVFEVASTIKLPKDANGFSQLQVLCPFYFDLRS